MVTVVKNPTGHKIIDQAIEATITEDYVGDALITFPYHGLGTGDYIYLTSDIDEYNGFWYVTAVTTDTFKISEYSTADYVEYYQDADIEYYQTQEHVWSSIFLPIVYKITSNLWPINTVDTARSVSSSSDDNGFTSMVLSGVLKATFNALEFVKISGATDDSINGVWQIVEVINTSEIVINLPYDTDNDFTGATVQYYYNNYQVKVKVYSGLPSTHPWEAKKPYTEVAELSLTPDDNGVAMFSISDYIKGKISIKNNTLIYSYPLNLDMFTGFYIATAETYDQSDGYSLSTITELYYNDTFQGYAVAGKLPFKNIYSGDYSDYIYTSGSVALWLTMLDRLLAIEDKYFDISFIKNMDGDFTVTINKYISDYLTTIETIAYTDQGIGVYRIPISPDATYDSFCISVINAAHDEMVPPEQLDLSLMVNGGPTGASLWIEGDMPYTTIDIGTETLWVDKIVLNGGFLKVNYTFTIHSGQAVVYFALSSAINALDDDLNTGNLFTGVYTGSITLTATADRAYFIIYAAGNAFITINSISFGDPTTVTIPAATVTEEICIDIIETCEALDGFVSDRIRLLEDGNYRLLE